MLNQTVLVGRMTNEVETKELKEEKKQSIITLAVSRSFKNTDGEYEVDYIPCVLWNGIAENTANYCHKGDVIGIKGRLQVIDNELCVIAEKVTFLSSKKVDEAEDGRKEE